MSSPARSVDSVLARASPRAVVESLAGSESNALIAMVALAELRDVRACGEPCDSGLTERSDMANRFHWQIGPIRAERTRQPFGRQMTRRLEKVCHPRRCSLVEEYHQGSGVIMLTLTSLSSTVDVTKVPSFFPQWMCLRSLGIWCRAGQDMCGDVAVALVTMMTGGLRSWWNTW